MRPQAAFGHDKMQAFCRDTHLLAFYPIFSDFFTRETLANPHKIRYIQKVGLIGALYEPR